MRRRERRRCSLASCSRRARARKRSRSRRGRPITPEDLSVSSIRAGSSGANSHTVAHRIARGIAARPARGQDLGRLRSGRARGVPLARIRRGVFTMADVARDVLDPLFREEARMSHAVRRPLGRARDPVRPQRRAGSRGVPAARGPRRRRGGVDVLVALGTSGEASTLEDRERDSSCRRASRRRAASRSSSGAGRTRPRRRSARAPRARDGRRRRARRHALLQQADGRRPRRALRGDRKGRARASRSSPTTCRAAPR